MTMKSKKRKIQMLPKIAFFIMLLMLGIKVRAADHPGWKSLLDGVSYDSETGLNKIAPGQYYLTSDYNSPRGFLVRDGDVEICLHGHKAFFNGDYGFVVRNGATLTITVCGGGDNLLQSKDSSTSSSTVNVADNASLVVNGGTIKSENGYAVYVSAGSLDVNNGTLSGGSDSVYMVTGELNVNGGTIVGLTNFGLNVLNNSMHAANVSITDGTVTGSKGGICAVSTGVGEINIDVKGGKIIASTASHYCIYQKTQNGGITISGGRFFGEFPKDMNVGADGGYYSDRTIEPYLREGYECKKISDTYYPFMVTKRAYTVVFTDGFGNTIKTETVYYGGSASAPANPVRNGYEFVGWDRGFTNITQTDSVITVNARWKETSPKSGSGISTYEGSSGAGTETAITVMDLKKVKGLKLRGEKNRITVRWTKPSKRIRKTFAVYEIQYGRRKDFADAKTKYVKKKASNTVLKKLKKNKRYYVRIRVLRVEGNVTHISKWVKRSVRTK